MRSSSRRKHRWFEAWPGVWMARSRNSVASMRKPSRILRSTSSPSRESQAMTSAPVRALSPAAPGEWSGWVWVQTIQRMRSPPQPAMASRWLGVVGSGVDDRDLVDADQVGVGAGAGHQPRVGGHDPTHQRAQGSGHAGDERRWRRHLVVRIDHFRRLATGHGFHLPVSGPNRPDRGGHEGLRPARSAGPRGDVGRHELVVALIAGQHDAQPALVVDDAGQDGGHLPDGRRRGRAGRRAGRSARAR